jgi:hypothetical protein
MIFKTVKCILINYDKPLLDKNMLRRICYLKKLVLYILRKFILGS